MFFALNYADKKENHSVFVKRKEEKRMEIRTESD